MDIKTKKLRIAKIEVEKLFGVYDYTLDCFSNKTEDNLIIRVSSSVFQFLVSKTM